MTVEEQGILDALEAIQGNKATPKPQTQEAELITEALNKVVEQPQAEEVQTEEVAENQEETQTEEVAEEVQTTETETETIKESVNENEQEDVLSFDDEEDAVAAENTPVFDVEIVEKLKAEVGVEVASKDDLVKVIKELKQKAEEAETAFASEELKVANELLKSGGDWQDYLGIASRDWDAYSEEELVKWQLSQEFQSKEEVEAAFDEMSDFARKREANRIRSEAKAQQQLQKQAIVEKVRKAQELYDANLKKAVTELDVVSKVKVKDSDKERIQQALLTYDPKTKATEFQKKYFLNEKGEPDFKKMAQSAVKLEMFDKIVEVASKAAKNKGKQEVIAKVSNVINPKEGKTIPEANPRKPLSPYEQNIERMKQGLDPLF